MSRMLPFVLLSFLAAGCGQPATSPPATPNPSPTPAAPGLSAAWEWTADASGGFKVEMPGRPTRSVTAGAGHFPECGPVNCVVFSVQNPDANFLINYWELDTPRAARVPVATLVAALRARMTAPDCAPAADREVQVPGGQDGRETDFARPTGTLTVRWVFAHRRLYMLTYGGKTADAAGHRAATRRFLDSFELTGATPRPAEPRWTDYDDPAGRFQARFLGTPKRQEVQAQNPNLGTVTFDVCETNEAGHSMTVLAVTVAPRPGVALTEDQVIDELRDAHARRQGGQVTSEKAVTLQGIAGREVVLATARQGTATLRYFPFDGKVVVVGSQGLAGTPPAEDTAKFFASFRFKTTDWLTFAPPGGRFSARFPETPRKGTSAVAGPRGPVAETVYRHAREDAAFSVAHADFDGPEGQGATMDQVVAAMRDSALRAAGARVVSEQPLQLGPALGGRELVAELPNRAVVRFRWVVHVRRVYSVGVFGLKAGPLPEADAAKFLDSFKVTP